MSPVHFYTTSSASPIIAVIRRYVISSGAITIPTACCVLACCCTSRRETKGHAKNRCKAPRRRRSERQGGGGKIEKKSSQSRKLETAVASNHKPSLYISPFCLIYINTKAEGGTREHFTPYITVHYNIRNTCEIPPATWCAPSPHHLTTINTCINSSHLLLDLLISSTH